MSLSARWMNWQRPMPSVSGRRPASETCGTDAAIPPCNRPALDAGGSRRKSGQCLRQHGHAARGQEATLLSFHVTLLHQGMVVVGLPYAFQGEMRNDEITGGSPYGATTIAGTKGERTPTENELAGVPVPRKACRRNCRQVGRVRKVVDCLEAPETTQEKFGHQRLTASADAPSRIHHLTICRLKPTKGIRIFVKYM